MGVIIWIKIMTKKISLKWKETPKMIKMMIKYLKYIDHLNSIKEVEKMKMNKIRMEEKMTTIQTMFNISIRQ